MSPLIKDKNQHGSSTITLQHGINLPSLIAILVLALLVVAGLGFGAKSLLSGSKTPPQVITQSTLEKVVRINRLSTFMSIYNGIATVYNEQKPDSVDYYVSYEATIRAGIDMEQVSIEMNEDEKKILVYLPKASIQDSSVAIESMDFIFQNDKSNTSTVSAQAYQACIHDLETESNQESAILENAQSSAENYVTALLQPLVEQLEEDYTLEVSTKGDAA